MLLPDQDRSRWDRDLIAEGQAIVRRCLRRNQPGPYQIQAAINAVHSDAATAAGHRLGPDRSQLYDQLLAITPNPVVALNRAVAVAEIEGPAPALAIVDALDLDTYHLFHATRAELLVRLDRYDDAGRGLRPRARAREQRRRTRATSNANDNAVTRLPRPRLDAGQPRFGQRSTGPADVAARRAHRLAPGPQLLDHRVDVVAQRVERRRHRAVRRALDRLAFGPTGLGETHPHRRASRDPCRRAAAPFSSASSHPRVRMYVRSGSPM